MLETTSLDKDRLLVVISSLHTIGLKQSSLISLSCERMASSPVELLDNRYAN